MRVRAMLQQLAKASENHVSGTKPILEFRTGTLPMDEFGNVRLADTAPGILRDYGWDRLVYVTDLPLTTRRPVISQTVEQGKALNAELKHKVEEAKEAPESKDAAPAETEDKAE